MKPTSIMIIALFFFPTVIRSGQELAAIYADLDNSKKYLFFDSNSAGLFSQFLQLKAMYKKAKDIGYNLVLTPIKSRHYGNMQIKLCDIFNLPSDISCKPLPDGMPCHDRWPGQVYFDKSNFFCYSGSISFSNDNRLARRYILDAVDYKLTMAFSDWALKYWKDFRNAFRLILKNRGLDEDSPYSTVHWRRGDQIKSRCDTNFDISVNCGDATELVELIRKSTNDSIVYIATNEKSGLQLSILQEAGYLTYDVVTENNKAVFSGTKAPNEIQILVVETKMMMHATTFLAWGISEVDDTVEQYRMMRNLTYCTGFKQQAKIGKQDSWCSRGRHKTDNPGNKRWKKKPTINNDREEDSEENYNLKANNNYYNKSNINSNNYNNNNNMGGGYANTKESAIRKRNVDDGDPEVTKIIPQENYQYLRNQFGKKLNAGLSRDKNLSLRNRTIDLLKHYLKLLTDVE